MSDMPEIFTGLYDNIFLQDIQNIYTGGNISDITKKFLNGNASVEEKRYFIQLKNQYFKVKKIKDYDSVQKQLYQGKSRYDIVSFEIARILKSESYDIKYSDQITNIKKLLSNNNNEVSNELYEKIVNWIIRIELSLGMKIGLFNEVCILFEKEIEKIDKANTSGLVYNKVK